MRAKTRTLGSLFAGLLLLTVVLSGCSLPWTGPDAQAAADALAARLGKRGAARVAFAGDARAAQSAYDAVVEGMPDPRVSTRDVNVEGDTATVRLRWRWPVGSRTWSYETTARLVKSATGGTERWLARWSPTMVEPSLRTGERLSRTGIEAPRGDILAADGRSIVTLRPVLRIGLDKTGLGADQVRASATRLARLVDVDAPALADLASASGPRAFVPAIVFRRQEVARGVLAGLSAIPGARAISDRLPLAPAKDFAAPILGTVGPATAEIVKASRGRVRAGDDVGLSGLQRRYDEQLAGTRGERVVAVAPAASSGAAEGRRPLFTAAAVAGRPLRTTIEPRSQALAQRLLSDVRPASALVAIRPSTGALVAVASGPGSQGYNTATFGRYAPGSTFKIVSALALLRAGEKPSSRVPCTSTTVVDGKSFKNYADYPVSGLGRISLETALANSCNTAFVSQRDRVRSLADAAAALGLGVDHDLGFPAYFGSVQPPTSETQRAAAMIGQGTVLASPMAMATVVASVLKGSAVLPRLLPGVEVEQKQPAQPLTALEARQLRQMMRAVVTRGSGSRLAGMGNAPSEIIAKTGTAEFGTERPLPTHAWMVAGRGDLAVAVFVERGESGSQTAGPILQAFLAAQRG